MSQSLRHVVREIYCEVLFELAEETGKIDAVLDGLKQVCIVLDAEPEFAAILNSPIIRGNQKSESVRRVFAGHISELTLDFLSVLARRNRMGLLSGIADRYELLVDKYHHREIIEVTVSKELDPQQVEKLKEQLGKAIQGQVKLSVGVDEGIIGGIIIKKDDMIIDSSVRATLQRAAQAVVENTKLKTKREDERDGQ